MQFCCSPKRLQLFTCIVGAAAIITVLIILFLANWPIYARRKLLDDITFKNGSIELERFTTTADLVNLRLEIYVYNITNPSEVVNSSAKIRIQQIGPFVYHEFKSKEILDNDQNSGLITYKLRKLYTFKPELSVGDPTKLNITWLNIPLLAAKAYLDELGFLKRSIAYAAFNQYIKMDNESAFITDTVDHLIFSGSDRKLFQDLEKIAGAFFKPWPLPDNKFAVLYNKNNTWVPGRDHVFTMSAGFGGNQTYHDLNQYVYMNGSRTLPFWRSEPPNCNSLGGTDGEFFAPFINMSHNLDVYSSDICRKLSLKFRDTVSIDGISTYRYTLDEKSLQSRNKNPDNDCYCLARDSGDNPLVECNYDGLIDLSKCVAPSVYASGVHFLYGSPELSQRIVGLPQVNASQDEPNVHVEPNTGLTIQVKVPLQLNVRLQKGGFTLFDWFNDVDPLIVPLMNVVEAAEMTSDQASQLRNKLLVLDSWLVSMVLGGTIIFILAIVAASVVVCLKVRRSRNHEPSEADPLLPSEDPEENEDPQSQQATTYRSI